jgi:pimeloyl-ACP methyl ester carboxylesterase
LSNYTRQTQRYPRKKGSQVNNYTEPRLSYFDASGARIAYFEWGERGAPPIVMIHATGFHARCWDQTIAHLAPGHHIIAVDQRGHGRSEKRGLITNWADPAKDIIELLQHLKLKPAVGVGHSKGGHILVQAAAALPGAFSRLLLIDPVIMSPEIYDAITVWPEGVEHPVARRRNSWASWEAMYEAFKDRKPYSIWKPEVLKDYCHYGVVPKADGTGVELACPPEIEASIYKAASGLDIYDRVRTIRIPVTVMRARQRDPGPRDHTDFSASPTWERLAEQFTHGRDVFLPELTHFIPMQDPALTADYIEGRR